MKPSAALLYRPHEPSIQTHYAELKERARAEAELLPGTPGVLKLRVGTGHEYWYRVYYPVPGQQVDELIGRGDDEAARARAAERIAFADWMVGQVSNLRKLQFQVADKSVSRVLVELYNRRAFDAGLAVVGTLAYMGWLNELGAIAVAARTQDIDLARRQRLRLAVPLPFLQTVQATRMPFTAVPGMPSDAPSTSVKLAGRDGLRIDVLAPGATLGKTIKIPELDWHAQTVPHYDYLLDQARPAALLAGGQCIPVLLPEPERMVWHKLYASAHRKGMPEKAGKDLRQAVTLAAILVEQDAAELRHSFTDAPEALKKAIRSRMPLIETALGAHPQVLEQFRMLWRSGARKT